MARTFSKTTDWPIPLPSNDEEILKEFTRALPGAERITLEVLTISWSGQIPTSQWVPVAGMPAGTPESEIHRARRRLLSRRKYFDICGECGERNPKGWMCMPRLCQGCAEKNHHVVF